jgi:hypothetical protein
MTITATREKAETKPILDRRMLDSSTEMREYIASCGYMVAVRSVGLSGIAVTALHAERPALTATGGTLHAALVATLGRLA